MPRRPSRPRPPGRRPGENKTREAVLDAARARFAKDGYAAATIRKIAAEAGVDASLVMQFFGSKEELFAEVMSIAPAALTRFAAAFEGPKQGIGERVARAFFDVWEGDPHDSEPLLAMLRASVSHEQTSAQLAGFLQARVAGALGAEHALRVGIASSMLVGVIVGRRLVRVPGLANAKLESLVAVIAPAVQQILVAPVRH